MKKKLLIFLVIVVALVVAFFHNDAPTTENIPKESEFILETTTAYEVPEEAQSIEETPLEITENGSIEDEEDVEEPEESSDMIAEDMVQTCTLLVSCEILLENPSYLDKEKIELVPEDGVLYPETTVVFAEGETVFQVLQREMQSNQIHLEFVNTPMYDSVYIEGIGNLYEFDAGAESGWMYSVNGYYPSYGCGQYDLEDGDVIHWQYTCDLGADLQKAAEEIQLGKDETE